MKIFGWAILVALVLVLLNAIGCALGWFGKAVDVVQQEIDPAVLQKKYEMFKEEAAAIDSRLATLRLYEKRTKAAHCDTATDRVTREQCMVWLQEQSGIASSYNDLAKDYNAQMAKWNYAFCNVGSLPKGATEPLPREFKPYLTE